MNQHFKETLFAMFPEDSGRFLLQRRKIDYDKMIVHGAVGNSGENYYTFIYRDTFEKQESYGGIYFLYKPFDITCPIHIGYKGPENLRERWNIYTGAAIYFLRKNFQDTMNIALAPAPARDVHDQLQETITAHITEETNINDKFNHFDFSIHNRRFQVKQLDLDLNANETPPPFIADVIKILEPTTPPKTDVTELQEAHLGLCLVIPNWEDRQVRFHPIFLNRKRDGNFGAVKPAARSQLKKSIIKTPPPLLEEVMGHLHQLSSANKKSTAGIDMVSRIYFNQLADLMLELPDHLTYCQYDTQSSNYLPLKKIKFRKIELRFAPAWHGNTFRIFPVLTGAESPGNNEEQEFDAGLKYLPIPKGEHQVYLFFTDQDNQPYFAVPRQPEKYVRLFRFLGKLREFPVKHFQAVLEKLRSITSSALTIQPEPVPFYHLKFLPTPVLKIKKKDISLKKPERIEVDFDYDSGIKTFQVENPHIRLIHYEKNKEFEKMCLYLLRNDPMLQVDYQRERRGNTIGFYFVFKDGNDLNWLLENSADYLKKGFRIFSERRRQFIGKTDSHIRIKVKPGLSWLEFKPLLTDLNTGETFEIAYIDYHNGSITDKDGTLHLLKQEDNDKLIQLSRHAQRYGDGYRVPSKNYYLINAFYDQRMEEVPEIKSALQSAEKLEKFKQIDEYNISTNFRGTLRSYQYAGFKWLRFLREYGLAGCLADDMGLGKTVQTLALLQTLKDDGKLRTSLLAVPVSAIPNWESEIREFTPHLTVHRHLGPKREKNTGLWKNVDLVITSYATLRIDVEVFKDFDFDYIILDESQNIKSSTSQVAKAVKVLKSANRLALSGTPIENSSMELWSLFDFLTPGFLGTREWFRHQWSLPVERDKNPQKTETLKKMLYPFILRRKKEEVEKDLPEKTEILETLKMDEAQLKLYIATAQYYSEVISRSIDEKGLEKSTLTIFEGMLRLRQLCLFPQLVNPENVHIPSVKFDHFNEMLEDILSEGHKVLVFSQFVKVLELLGKHLENRGMTYSYIDGSVPVDKRREEIRVFQEDEDRRLFLLSLKAGGVALNLTAADYVIIFDPWWNPAVEAQAIDRSHRIGQTKKVLVYRMVVKDTIEEKMMKLQEQKRELVDNLITTESGGIKNLTPEDIMELFRIS
jgi:SNF2 family DNA or RNA helicase